MTEQHQTLLTVAVMVESEKHAHAVAALAAEHGADLVEYRFDLFHDDIEAMIRIIKQSPLPCIATLRAAFEGGDFDGTEQERISLIEHLGLAGPAYIDVELAAYIKSDNLRQKVNLVVDHDKQPREVNTRLILSSHDFKQRPADLYRNLETMIDAPACRIIKFAWMARSLRDNLEAFELIDQRQKPTIALCMAETGLASRVLSKKFGAFLTFVGIDDRKVTAPGQPGLQTIKQLYRWDQLNRETKVYGVIGWPVAHSLSPDIHNKGFDETGFNGVYLPMPIPPEYEHFKASVGAWLDDPRLDFYGASVTLPHKENLIRFVKEQGGEVEPLAESIGSANTLIKTDKGLSAINTDYAAALDSVLEAMGRTREQCDDLRVAVIGAGGVARAMVAGFSDHGATVVVYNRTLSRAQSLAAEFNAKGKGKVVAAALENLKKSCCQVYVNCTSVGMSPNIDASPMPDLPECIGPDTVVFDTIYIPEYTQLLQEAEARGAKIVTGIDMFVRQGMAQFEAWTGQPAPAASFRAIMREKLAAKAEEEA